MVEFKLNDPIEFEGKKYDEVSMDLESLKGRDISKVKSQWAQSGKFSPFPATDMDFCAMLACLAAKLPTEFADELSARDFIGLTTEVTNFLQS